MSIKKRHLPKAGINKAAILCAALSAPTYGQDTDADEFTFEEIVVTASKRAQLLSDLPQSIQALKGDDLESQALTAVEDITSLVPNLNLNASAKRGGGFNIRGIAALSEQFSQFATVGLYLDETPISDGFANFDVALFDLERIEVLKGPQGTLYGEGSLSGTVRLITAKPELGEFYGKAQAAIETTRHGEMSYRTSGALNIPLSEEKAALRLTASYKDEGGFMDSTVAPGAAVNEDVNDTEAVYVKAAVKLQLSDKLTATPGFLYQKRQVGAGTIDAEALPELTGFANGPNDIDENLKIYSLEVNYDLSWADLVSSTSYLDRFMTSQDDDIATNAIISAFFAPSDVTTQLFDRSIETFTQELRLVSKGDSKLDWLIGGFYRDRKYQEDVEITNPVIGAVFADPRVFTQDNRADYKQIAVFGEANYHLTDTFTLTAGARWFEEDISSNLDFGTLSLVTFGFETVLRTPEIKQNDILLKFAASYQPNDDLMFYGLYTQGVRPGGVNDRVLDILDLLSPAQEDTLATFGADSTDNYEIGVKASFLDDKLRVNLAGFYIDWTDIQLDSSFNDIPGPEFTINAGKAKSMGLEAEVIAIPTRGLQLGAFLGYNDAEVTEETETSAGVITDGATLPFAPKFSSNLYMDYLFNISDNIPMNVRLDWRHTGKRNAAVDIVGNPAQVLASYDTLDARVSMDIEDWTISLYAKNLTDTRAEMDALLFNDGLLGNALASYVRNKPRTFGLQVQASF